MLSCPSCGIEIAGAAKFCNDRSAPLGAPRVTGETRRTVTVHLCDVVGSTALGEIRDPGLLRAKGITAAYTFR